MVETKVELGSLDWVDLARVYLEQNVPVPGSDVAGLEFTICEVFTNPPAHLDDGSGRVAWWLAVRGRSVEVGQGDRTDADVRIEVEYDTVLPRARMVSYRETVDAAPT